MSRYSDIEILRTLKGNRYYATNFYPTIPLSDSDIYVITDERDRYDLLANQYYNDSSLWWIIASANTSTRSALNVEKGVQLRIPASKEQALQLYNEVNRNR